MLLSTNVKAQQSPDALQATPVAQAEEAVRMKDDKKLAQLAYEYAYSIDEAYKYFYETVIKVDYPLNQFQNIRTLADHTYTAHPTINNDTFLFRAVDLALYT